MQEENNIETRLDTIERRFDTLLKALYNREDYPVEPKELNKDKFAKAYNMIKYSLPIETDMYPAIMYLNSKYKESALKDLLYPTQCEDLYYPTGELSPIAIGFRDDIDVDYVVQCYKEGFFA